MHNRFPLWDDDQLSRHCVVSSSAELSALDRIRARLVCSEPEMVIVTRYGIDVDAQSRDEEAMGDIQRDDIKVNYFPDLNVELVLYCNPVRKYFRSSVWKRH